jgi:hypothetical protein
MLRRNEKAMAWKKHQRTRACASFLTIHNRDIELMKIVSWDSEIRRKGINENLLIGKSEAP